MLLDTIRSVGKRILHRTPFRAAAKEVWNRLKAAEDRRQFNKHYPKADYVLYDQQQIASFHQAGFKSQFGQDHYLWTHFLSSEPAGCYVDIGANLPVVNSNSYYLEQQGWKGVAVDPLRSLQEKWAKERNATFLNMAISSQAENRPFVEVLPRMGWEHTLSSFKGFVRPEDIAIYETVEYDVPCLPLSQALPPAFTPDLILIDVEGAEPFVIEGLDFSVSRPRLIMCENDCEIGGNNNQRAMIERLGYQLVARLGAADDLFLRID